MFSGICGSAYIARGSANPSSGAGVRATLGSLYLRSTGSAGTLFQKTGTSATAWTQIVPASFTGTLAVTGGITATTTIVATQGMTAETFTATSAGTAAAPSFALPSAKGMYAEDANTISFAVGAVRYFRIAAAGVDILNTLLTYARQLIGSGVQASELSATTSNLVLGTVSKLRLTTSGGAQILTSLTAGAAGRFVWIENNNAVGGDNVTLLHDDGASGTAANRFAFALGANIILTPKSGVWASYNGTDLRWMAARV